MEADIWKLKVIFRCGHWSEKRIERERVGVYVVAWWGWVLTGGGPEKRGTQYNPLATKLN